MIGALRPLSRYAVPRSPMKVVGEWVRLEASGLSEQRGESAPPITWMRGDTAFSADYALAGRERDVGAAASPPSSVYCGCQNRFRLGSFPTMKSWMYGTALAIDAQKAAKSSCCLSVRGVYLPAGL